jgi:uncharacterized protein (UPF0264 family)
LLRGGAAARPVAAPGERRRPARSGATGVAGGAPSGVTLLVSVARAGEVAAALEGGAGILDVKDPARGSLGAAAPAVVSAARRGAPPAVVVSAALGDALPRAHGEDPAGLPRLASELAAAGADVIKVGLADVDPDGAALALRRLREAVAVLCGGRVTPRIVAVAFADTPSGGAGVPAFRLPAIAATAGLAGAMLDTRRKGTSIVEILGETGLRRWVAEVRARGLLAGIAGSLRLEELPRVAAVGPDVAGLRGAVCVGGRAGALSAELVRRARRALGSAPPA